MYVAVSHALEVVTGVSLGEFLRTRLWEPLGMRNTFLSVEDAQAAQSEGRVKLAHGYRWDELGGFQELPYAPLPHFIGSMGVISNAVDHARWISMMMHSTMPVSRKGHMALTSPRSILVTPGSDELDYQPRTCSATYALGWYVHHYHGYQIIFHGGIQRGFGSFVGYMPREKFGFVVMANVAPTKFAPSVLAFQLVENFLNIPKPKRFDWQN